MFTELLERISRVTGALTLASADHMIQQYGKDCLGTCHRFFLRAVTDDPERLSPNDSTFFRLQRTYSLFYVHVTLDFRI